MHYDYFFNTPCTELNSIEFNRVAPFTFFAALCVDFSKKAIAKGYIYCKDNSWH